MTRRMDFQGRFADEARRSLVPGASYVGVRCTGCGLHIGMIDEPGGAGALSFGGEASFDLRCPNCGVRADYRTGDLEVFRAAQGGPASTA